MPEQPINEQTRQMMGMPTSGDPAIIDPTTGRPYTADASMRQQEEITRQAEVKEEFASEQRLQLPKDLEEEIEEEIRPKARPEGLPNIYEKKTAIDKTLEYGYLLKERQPGAKGKTKIVTGLDERNPAHQKIIKAFFDSAVGGDTGFNPTKQAWCAAFVNHILTEMGADLIESKDPYKRLRANEYKTYGKPVDLENIQEGDIVVFDFDKDGTADHVTFYAGGRITSQGEGQYINVIGGNQGGGEVSIRENEPGYTLDNVAAIRRVTYDGDAYEIAQSHKDSDPVFKTFLPEEHEDYALNLQGNYNEGGDVAAQMDLMLPSADDDIRPEDYTQYKPDDFTGRSFAADSFQETKDRFMDAGKIDVDPNDPAIFTAYKRAVDYLKDTGLAGLGLADTAFKYAVGSVAQVMPTEQLEKRMARDLYSMPEAFGGAVGAKSITQLDDAADAFLEGSRQVAQKLKTEYDPTMVRSFVGATPPTYQEREAPLSFLSGESDSASDEYLNLLNLESLMFKEPIAEFAKTVNIPKKGLLGSEFLSQIKKNPSIPETSIQDEIIDPSKRYTRDELLNVVEGRGISQSFANIAKNKMTQFERYQRQRRDAGFVGGTEINYFDIPVVSNVGFPGKKFKAHSQHYEDGTLVHVRGSIIDSSVPFSEFNTGPSGEIVIDSTRKFTAFDTIIDDDNFLLVEEIQSDLLTKGYVKPKSPFDAAFSEAIDEYNFESPVKYQEAYGDISTDIQKIFKELDEEGIYSPELPIQLEPFSSNPFFSPETETAFTNKILDKGYTTFEELKDYIKSQNTNSDEIWGILSRLERKVPGVSVVNDAPGGKTYTNISLDLNDPTFENFLDTFYESVKGSEIDHDILMHKYEDFIDNYNEVLLKKIKEKGLSKELDLNDLQRLRERYEESGAKGTLSVGLPPIRKNKQAVDEAFKVLIAKAAQQGVDKIVIPPAERIAMARGRELKKDKGDRFYRTYVTDLNKSLKELEDNYPVIVHRDVELPYLSKTDVDDGDPFGMMNEPDFTEIDEDGVALEDIQDLMDAEVTEPSSKKTKLVETGNKGTILDISELIDKYKIEQPRQFAKGGVAMNEQMEMAFMNQGGLKDDGMNQDPVSGNEIPNGSMAKEVRDDISAQLSEGEYVVPADVVRYLGVKHFEDLRDKAKQGLQSMEANGRIGGEPVPVGGPQAAPMMQPPMPQASTPYSPQPAPPQMAMGGDLSPEEMNEINNIMMAQGGMVPTDPYQQQQMQYTQPMAMGAAEGTDVITGGFYNPGGGLTTEQTITTPGPLGGGKYTGELSTEVPQVGITETEVPVENEASCEARGMVFNSITGMCETPDPVPERVGGDGSSSTPPTAPGTPGTPGSFDVGFKNWGAEVDWTDPESVEKFVTGQYNMPDPALRKGAGVAGLLGAGPLAAVGTVGSIFMAGQVLDTVADLRTSVMIAKAYGNTEGAAIAQAKLDAALKGAPSYVTSSFGDIVAPGTRQFAGHVSGASGLDDLPSDIDAWTENDFTRFQSAVGKKAPVTPEPTKTKKTALPPSTQPTMDTAPRRESGDSGPSGAEVARAAANRTAAASEVAKSEGVSAPTSGGARSVSAPKSETRGTGKKETYASKVERGGGFNKGGLMLKKKKK